MGWNYRSHVPSIRYELLELRVEGGFRLHYLPISRSGIFRFVHVHVFLLDFPISADSDRQLSGNGQSDAQFSSQSFGLAVSGNCQTDSKFAGQDRRTDDIQHIWLYVGSLCECQCYVMSVCMWGQCICQVDVFLRSMCISIFWLPTPMVTVWRVIGMWGGAHGMCSQRYVEGYWYVGASGMWR